MSEIGVTREDEEVGCDLRGCDYKFRSLLL